MAIKMQTITTLELLPNEIFIEWLEYLNALDIFHSFYRLNYRFDKLIRNIPLKLSFQHVRKTIFDQVCKLMLSNPEIKRQIHSLRLSNSDTCGQIQAFLSLFSLDEFNSLRSLTLTGIEKMNLDKLQFMLLLLPKSCSLHWIDPDDELKKQLTLPSVSGVQTLSTASACHLPLVLDLSSVTNLTIADCSCGDLCQLFRHLTMLKYLNVRKTFKPYIGSIHIGKHHAVYLQQLIMMDFSERFENFEMLAKLTPNLKSLMISSSYDKDMIDAHRWEYLITSSIPLLTVFKFKFSYDLWCTTRDHFGRELEGFQTAFWKEQHHWYTVYSRSLSTATIYTIPYMLTAASYNDLPNGSEAFDNITDLTVYLPDETKNGQYYLKNVTTLCLNIADSEKYNGNDTFIGRKHFQSLKMMINLSNLKHLTFSGARKIDVPYLLLEILKQAPQLSSLSIGAYNSALLFTDDKLCKYLNKQIKKLHLISDFNSNLFINDEVTEKFCKIFSNLEQLLCSMEEVRYLLVLLKRLSKLSIMKVTFLSRNAPVDFSTFEEEVRKSNILFRTNSNNGLEFFVWDSDSYETVLSIWIGNTI
jgi:hypothetical protein